MLSPFANLTYPVVYDPVLGHDFVSSPASFDDLWTSFVQTFVTQDVAHAEQKHRHLD